MTEWYEKYQGASKAEIIAQALEACAQHDCAHCLYQGKGIQCAARLKLDAARLILGEGEVAFGRKDNSDEEAI